MSPSASAPPDYDAKDLRVLILAPHGRDATLAEETLIRSGLLSHVCAGLEALRREIAIGAGAVLIAEEALADRGANPEGWFAPEPPWSSLPIVVLLGRSTRSREFTALHWFEHRPNVSFLERPVPKRTMISTLRAAIAARRLQYAIRDALDASEAASRKKDEFLATLAHELRNPLAPIRNAVYVLNRLDVDDPASREKARSLNSIVGRQVDHLVRLVDDLLEISRITMGKIVLKKQRVDLAQIIDQAVEISEPLVKSGQHELIISPGQEQLFIDGDPVRLAQVLANLINNSARYTPPGGRIEVSLQAKGDNAVVSVRDNGIGIPPEMLPRVFDLFLQSATARDRGQGGLGIGLALVRSLTELHGGHVEAHSDGADRGSEFIVRLPLTVAPQETAIAESAPLAALVLRPVLVVDDNKDVADSFAMLLESLGVEARVAYSGAEALSNMEIFKPRVAFIDLGMPVMDGYATARQIRSRPEGRDMLLVALSGWGSAKDRRLTMEAGFNYHIVKPVNLDTVKNLLASVPSTNLGVI